MVILIGSNLAGFVFASLNFCRLDAWSLCDLFITSGAFLLITADDFLSTFKDWKYKK